MSPAAGNATVLNPAGVRASIVGRFPCSGFDVTAVEVCLAVAVFLVFHAFRQKKARGLPVWPVVGMLPSMIWALRDNTYEWITDVVIRQGGTFTFNGPWFTNLNCVVTSDPRNLEFLLKAKFWSFPKGEYFRNCLHDLLGDGIFNADDEPWQMQRKTASLEFHSGKFRKLTASTVGNLVYQRLLPVLDAYAENGAPLDLQDVLLRLTFDNVCMVALGVDSGCLKPGLPEIPFAKSFEEATEMTTIRFLTPTAIWKAMRFLNIGPERRLKQSVLHVKDYADSVIKVRKAETALEGGEKSDLLSVIMRLKDEEGSPYSDKFLRDICINFILAGRDTSSVALSWFFWLLEQNPAVEEKILDEIHRIVAARESSKAEKEGSSKVVLTAEEVKKMEYLHAALSEALRLYPSVPVDHKEVREDEIFPDGTVLKKGTKVIYAIYSMGRMESIWGKDCREFKPERWIRDGRFMSESAYRFTAFNGGPRLCLGKDFAYYQMKQAAAAIISRFRVRVVPGHPVEPKMALTMYMKHGLKVVLQRRHPQQS
ncbi:cytochrome P450 86B1-like [Nymphaea colorata]|nr:cytochrome P450 86B1-like [Nymphaea colorata]